MMRTVDYWLNYAARKRELSSSPFPSLFVWCMHAALTEHYVQRLRNGELHADSISTWSRLKIGSMRTDNTQYSVRANNLLQSGLCMAVYTRELIQRMSDSKTGRLPFERQPLTMSLLSTFLWFTLAKISTHSK